MKVFDISSHDGEKISMYLWADVKSPKGVVQLVHGMSEHLGRYDEFAHKLNAAGYIVVGDDHRAHGKTAGEIAKVGKTSIGDLFIKTVKDLQFICANTKNTYPDLPYYVIGHSYGSFLVQRFLEYNSRMLSGAILMGTACKKGDFQVSIGRFLAKFTKKENDGKLFTNMTFGKYDKQYGEKAWLSRDPQVAATYLKDEYCTQPFSYGFYKSLFYGFKMMYNKNELEKIDEKLPILILNGKDDPVSGKEAKQALKLQKLYSEKLGLCSEIKIYDGARHELFNETNKEDVFADIIDFLSRAIEIKQKNVIEAEARQAEETAAAKAALEAQEAERARKEAEKAAKAAAKKKD